MKPHQRLLAIIVGATLALGLLAFSPTLYHSQAQDKADTISSIDGFLTRLVENRYFSGTVLIAQDGEILLSQGYGLANREWDIPNTPQTKFRIGSITKQFTAMAILRLQEQGALSVDDPICTYIDDCPEIWQSITIHHLLTHTSGIPSFTKLSDYSRLRPLPSNGEITLQRFIDLPLDFEPGTEFYYSNSGYIVLGLIIEEVSGQSYRYFLKDTFFEPLGMENTDTDSNTRVVPYRAEGYISSSRKADFIDMSIPYAAGSLYSSVEDLYIWDQALYGGDVVTSETWDAMLAAAYPIPDSGVQYGYGLIIDTASEHPTIAHGGGIEGFVSQMIHYTDDNTTVIILSNWEQAAINSIVQTIESRLLGAN